ncbi:hypothetical protein BP422_23485 [Brevibacillus formosus]|uniref:Uncharacterized protein n=1 Tax=Brevibacillus formosus TaxID=54913 RepID=A0A220MMB8_9BACL|nr:hypothetical protein BP422_23485 [Brevibacillus formosus]
MAPTEGMCSLVTLNGTVRALRKLKGNVNYQKRCGLQSVDEEAVVEERKKEKPLRLLVTPAGGLTGRFHGKSETRVQSSPLTKQVQRWPLKSVSLFPFHLGRCSKDPSSVSPFSSLQLLVLYQAY